MAFTGVAVVKQVSDAIVRITGVSLANGATGNIGLFGKTVAPDVTLPASFIPKVYAFDGVQVTLQDAISVEIWTAAGGTAVQNAYSIIKTGTTNLDFNIAIKNESAAVGPNLEIYVKFHM